MDLWSTRARSAPSFHSPFISMTGALQCLYYGNKRRAECSTANREAKSPRPVADAQTLSNRAKSSLLHCRQRTCRFRLAVLLAAAEGSKLVASRPAPKSSSASADASASWSLTVYGGGWGGVARILTDRAEFLIGTGSTNFAPCQFHRRSAPQKP